jgi:hypothetical protein
MTDSAAQPLIWEGQELVTYGDIGRAIERIITDGTKDDAKRFIDACEAVNPHARKNVGYLFGYYGAENMKKIWDWFECSHPMFGRIVPTPKAGDRTQSHEPLERLGRRPIDLGPNGAVIEWKPNFCRFILDGNIVGTSTSRVPNTPMHWVLQSETELNSTYPAASAVANVQIDYVRVWKYVP